MDSRIIRFYDKDYHLLAVDDDAETIYTSKWNTCGSFEFFLKEMNKGVKKGNRVVMGDDGRKNGIITYIYQSEDKITIRGYSLLWLLSHRITIPKEGNAYLNYNGPVEDVMYGLVKDNATNAVNTKRNFPHLTCAASQGRGATYKYKTRYDNLLECLQEISAYSGAGIGIKVIPEEAKEVFEVRFGKDKSIEQNENPQVVFRYKYDNILTEEYTINNENYKNMAYVGGQGEGVERVIVKLGDSLTGENRREIFVDARDIEDTTELTDRGNTKLSECSEEESFEVSTDSTGYGTRWNLGDKVTVIGDISGIQISNYITQITETVDESGVTLSPVFGLAESGISGGGSSGSMGSVIDYSNPFYAATAISSGSNLNNITEPGVYSIWGSITNGPATAVYGFLRVTRFHSTYLLQEIYSVSSSSSNVKIYVRRRKASEWGDWNTIY